MGTPAVPFFLFDFGVSLLKLNSRKKGTLSIKGLLANLEPRALNLTLNPKRLMRNLRELKVNQLGKVMEAAKASDLTLCGMV